MPPSLTSQATAEIVNVSQGFTSSPIAKGPLVPPNTLERVEDSLLNGTTVVESSILSDAYSERVEDSMPKDTNPVTLPATIVETQPASDHDELYALSPNGKSGLAKAALKEAKMRAEAHGNGAYGEDDTAGMIAAQTARKPATRSAIDDLLAQGATARPIRYEQSRVMTSSREAAGEGMEMRS